MRRPLFLSGLSDGRLDFSRRHFGGCVARFLGLVFLVGFLVLAGARSAFAISFAGVYPTEAAAFTACQAYTAEMASGTKECRFISLGADPYRSGCNQPGGTGKIANAVYEIYFNGTDTSINGTWCVPSSCPSGTSAGVSGGTQPPLATDGLGCCADWSQVGSYSYGGTTWASYDGVRNGQWCSQHYTSANPPASSPPSNDPPKKMCDSGGLSCYSPQDNTACYVTESGEQVCVKLDSSTGNCASGATGSVCYGKDGAAPPPPSDPPITKDQPPDSSVQGSQTGSAGDSTFTQNNYSGTSPGGSGGSGGDTSGDKAGGSQSNQNGSGNSSGPSGDHGTDTNGKCPDGSVPTASGCSGTATDAGCDTPPQCFGDAVLCASFKEQVAIRCNTKAASSSSSGGYGDPSAALAANGVPADGGASGDPSASGLVTSSDIGQDGFDASGLGFSRSCPANPTFSVLGHSYTLDLGPFCNFAGMLSWFVLLCASLVGLRIVASGRA